MKFFILAQVIGIATAILCDEKQEYFFNGDIITENGNPCTKFGEYTKVYAYYNNLKNLSLVTEFGDLIISDPWEGHITSLEGLENVVEVQNLIIQETQNLTNFEGLDKLRTINKGLSILYNSKLENIDALYLVTSVGFINIQINWKLKNIDGLNRIVESGGILINSNRLLERIRFRDLERVNGYIWLSRNNIVDYSGFNKLISVYSNIKIEKEENLKSITGFANLPEVKNDYFVNNPNLVNQNDIKIAENPNLQTITGFNNLNEVFGSLTIKENPKLQLVTFLSTINKVGNFILYDIYLYYLCQMTYSFETNLYESIISIEKIGTVPLSDGGFYFDSTLSLTNYCAANNVQLPTPSPTISPTSYPTRSPTTLSPTFTTESSSSSEFPVLPVVGGLVGVLGLVGIKYMCCTPKKDEDLPVINSPVAQVVPVL